MGLEVIDILVLIFYFSLVLFLGSRVARKNKTIDDYFVAGRNIAGWAVGFSILSTCISSVTYIAYPGMAFMKDWQYLVQGLMLPVLIVSGGLIIVKFYRSMVKISVNEYLEARFGPGIRAYSLIVLIISELARLSMVMYLLSLVIHTITGWSLFFVILLVGLTTTIYTVLGGIEGVIWTDVIQTIVLFLGGIVTITIAVMKIPGGFQTLFQTALEDGKFKLFDFSFTLSKPAFYVLCLSGLVNYFYFLAGNQNQIQRYQCASSEREARKATIVGTFGSLFAWSMFMMVGTSLYVFYKYHPEPIISQFISESKPDKVFPYFISTQLHYGLAGLLLAGVFASAMSTLDSSMNTLSTLFIVDFYKRFINPKPEEKKALSLAKLLCFIWGASGIALALSMTRVGTFLEFYFQVVAIITGGIAGIFFLALFTKKTHSTGMALGIIAGLLTTLWGSTLSKNILPSQYSFLRFPFDPIMVGVLSTFLVIATGYLSSVVIHSSKTKKLLTLLDVKRN